jgi:hypothetical protein
MSAKFHSDGFTIDKLTLVMSLLKMVQRNFPP